MITRRHLILGACSALLPFAAVPTVDAHDRILVEELVYGVSDALIRSYIRRHCDRAYWHDGYWWLDGRRYSVIEYRNYLIEDYYRDRRRRQYGHRPPPPPHHRPPPTPRSEFGHRPPPPPKDGNGNNPKQKGGHAHHSGPKGGSGRRPPSGGRHEPPRR